MLTTLKDVLADARENGYAVPAFDCVEDVMVRAILETCEEVRSPVVLMCLIGADLDGNGWAYVPVEVHFPRDRPPVLAMPPPPPPPPGPRVSEGRPKRTPGPEYPNMTEPPLPRLPPLRKNLK